MFSESKTIDCSTPFDTVTEKGMAIISPNFPNRYTKRYDATKNCQLTIKFDSNETIAITFVAFNVFTGSWDTNCKRDDYLAIYDGNSTNSPIIGSRLCGTNPSGTTIMSTTNQMTLHFHAKCCNARNARGFKLYANAARNDDVISTK